MEKIIEGTITYKMKINGEDIQIEYGTSIDNDLAVLAMSQYIAEMCAVSLRDEKKDSTGKMKQIISENLDRILKGRNALQTMVALYLHNYDDFMKMTEDANNKEVEIKPLNFDQLNVGEEN